MGANNIICWSGAYDNCGRGKQDTGGAHSGTSVEAAAHYGQNFKVSYINNDAF